jgi:hypothetical protein
MFAAYVEKPNYEDPIAALVIGKQPEPHISESRLTAFRGRLCFS